MRGDKRGPENRGQKTGRGLGFCNGNDKPGYESNQAPQGMRRGGGPAFGRGARGGFGRGLGRGFGRRYGWSTGPYENEMTIDENNEILDRLEKIENQLKAMGDK